MLTVFFGFSRCRSGADVRSGTSFSLQSITKQLSEQTLNKLVSLMCHQHEARKCPLAMVRAQIGKREQTCWTLTHPKRLTFSCGVNKQRRKKRKLYHDVAVIIAVYAFCIRKKITVQWLRWQSMKYTIVIPSPCMSKHCGEGFVPTSILC